MTYVVDEKIMNILVIFGTTEGQTRKVAKRVAECIEAKGHTATVVDSTEEQSPIDFADYNAIIIAGSVHQGHYQGSLTYFISSRLEDINRLPNAFLSINLSMVSSPDCKEANADVEHLLADTGWKPSNTKLVAGALKYSQYDFFKRQMMRLLSKQKDMPSDTREDYEFTDWDDLQAFVTSFLKSIDNNEK